MPVLINFGILGLVVLIKILGGKFGVESILLGIGWGLGFILADLDHLLYILVTNAHELTSLRIKQMFTNRDWKAIWQEIENTKSERMQMAVHNVVTGLVLSGVGLWLVTSSGSLLASGLVVSLGIKLFIEFAVDRDSGKWYWLLPRPMRLKEVWAALLALQLLLLVR